MVRRNGSWLATPGANVSSFVDTNPVAGATYVLRSWGADGTTSETCTTGPATQSPTDCTVTDVARGVQLKWADDGGVHIIRRNGSWLATPGPNVSSYVDTNPFNGASYLVRTRTADGAISDRACRRATTQPTPTGDRRFVVHVSIDGLRADQVRSGNMTTLAKLANNGASTLNARTDPALTQTLPNHTSQFTGRFVWGSRGHRIAVNEDPGITVHQAAGGYVSSVFDVVHDNGGRTVVYTGKSKFSLIENSWGPRAGAPDTTGVDNGRDKIDVFEKEPPDVSVGPFVRDLVAGRGPTFGFFHIRTPDEFGHVSGWNTPGYYDAVRRADANLEDLVDELDRVGILDQTTIIVTSDHGGPTGSASHRDASLAANFTIPFVVYGADVGTGVDLYAINRTRVDPGNRLVNKSGPQPVRGHDAGNLALDLLGLPPIPGSVVNADHSLRVR